MSCLTVADLSNVSALVDFINGPGYVLDFSDRTFSHYFGSEFDIDIDDPRYADVGRSKGKRLRRFLQMADDATAARVLEGLWEYRAALIENRGLKDPIAGAAGKYQALMRKLGGLPAPQAKAAHAKPDAAGYSRLKGEVTALASLNPQERGYAFQRFLYGLFELHGLDPRKSFRNTGEEIDGSFVLGGNHYLLEAKWQAKETGVQDLHAFEGKLSEKAPWVRGFFMSYVGFSADGLAAWGRAKRTLCMNGLDLFDMLDRQLTLDQVLEAKARRAAETGMPFVHVRDLF